MSESPEELQLRIAELEAQLRALKAAQASPSRISGPQLNQPVSSARDTYIATNQTVNVLGPLIYGPDPSAEQREQLVRYLQRLAAKLQRLSLNGLAAPVADVERRVGQDEIGLQVGVQVAVEAVGVAPSDIALDAADRQVHLAQPPGGRVHARIKSVILSESAKVC